MADAGTGAGIIAMAAASITVATINAGATTDAADIYTKSADRAADLINTRYLTTRGDFDPYRALGVVANQQLSDRLNEFTATSNPYAAAMDAEMPELPLVLTQDVLEQMPGYLFALQQGTRATRNGMAARGLGISGASDRSVATFVAGMASQTVGMMFGQQQARFGMQQQRFANVGSRFAWDQGLQVNAFNRLNSVVTTGQNSAAQTGRAATESANQAGQALMSGGAAAAGGVIAGANATAGGINGLANTFNQWQQQKAYGLNGSQVSSGSSNGLGRWLGNQLDTNSDGSADYSTGSDGVMTTGAYGS